MTGRGLSLAFSALCLTFILSIAPIQAQQNPPLTSCGLPAGGFIVQDATYSLSEDCVLTSILDLAEGVSVTINGNGHTITSTTGPDVWITAYQRTEAGPSITLNQVTLDGEGERNAQVLSITNLTANQVTFRGNRRGIWDVLSNPFGPNWNLNNVLFLDNTGDGFTNGSALEARNGAVLTMRNVAFIRNTRGTAALRNDGDTATISATGCFTYVANYPRTVRGSWADNSTGRCSGTLGNGYRLDIHRARPAACGFPNGGYVPSAVTFTLSDNCLLGDTLHITEDITVTINGNGHKIQGYPQERFIWIAEGARVNINDVYFEGARFNNYGHIEAWHLVFTETAGRLLYNYGTANFNGLMLMDLEHTASAYDNAIFTHSGYRRGDITIRDGMFMHVNNGSSAATLWAWGPTIDLNDCITFVDNIPANTLGSYGGSVNDNSDGDCPETMIDEFPRGLPAPDATPIPSPVNIIRDRKAEKVINLYPTPTPVATCPSLPPRVRVDQYTPRVHCQIVDEIGVGKPEVIVQGIIDAVDVWTWDYTPIMQARVCFLKQGRTVFLDAAYAPRTVEDIPSYQQDGRACVFLDRPGTVALLVDRGSGQAPPPPSSRLAECMATTKNILNLRDAPGGAVIDMMPYNISLTALEWQAGWYKVDYLGRTGWVKAGYVTLNGACD